MLASEEGLISTIGGASWPTNSVEPAARELGKGSTKPEQGKGAPAGGRLLAAEEVDVELAGELAARELGDQCRGGDARLADRGAGRARGWPPDAGGGSTNCGTSLLLTARVFAKAFISIRPCTSACTGAAS